MAQFYGRVQGGRSEATRCGTRSSGLTTSAETWTYKIVTELYEHGLYGECARVSVQTKNGTLVRVLFDGALDQVTMGAGVAS